MRSYCTVVPVPSRISPCEGLKERTTPRILWPFMLIAVLTSIVMTLAEVGKALATVELFTIDGQPLVLSAIEQNREEVWNWFNPGVVKGGLDQHQYNFWVVGYARGLGTNSTASKDLPS